MTRDATFRFGEAAVAHVNTLVGARGHDQLAARASLESAFRKAQEHLGATRTTGGAPAKRSMFSWYLRMAGIDGMMNPFFLEIILNPDVLPVERPFALAHEWAHLAGYANESEANFVAWLTCSAADASGQYSGWLEAYRYVVASLPRDDRRALQQRLAPEVVADLRAINERLGRADPKVSGLARNVYDSYLRAQGVDEGIASYGAMLRLLVGTTFENGWTFHACASRAAGVRLADCRFMTAGLANRAVRVLTSASPGRWRVPRAGHQGGRARVPRARRPRASASIHTRGIEAAVCRSATAAAVPRHLAASTDTPAPSCTTDTALVDLRMGSSAILA